MFAASVFIAMVKFFLCISVDLQKERTLNHKSAHRIYFFSTQNIHTFQEKKKKKKYIAFNNFLFCFNSKYHFNCLCV